MQNTIKEELQQLLPANLVDAQLSDAELESVAGGIFQYSTGGEAVVASRPGYVTQVILFGNTSGRITGSSSRLSYSGVTVQSV